MSSKEINISSLEEFIAFILKPENRYEAKNRFSLNDNSHYDHKQKKTVVEEYYLWRSSGWSFSFRIKLSTELGEMMDKVWTKKEPYRAADYKVRYGSLSLTGILKRLGKDKEVSAKFKAVEAAEKKIIEKRSRNNARHGVKDAASKIIDIMNSHPEIWGGKVPDAVISLSQLIDEE